MPQFRYKAKKGPTEIIEGEIDAENEDAALGKIAALGLIPIKLEPLTSGPPEAASASFPASPAAFALLTPQNKAKLTVTYRDLNVFTRQFAILLKANVPLLRIFQVLQTQTQSLKFRQALWDMQNSLREGGSLSEVLASYPRIFSQIYISMIHAGEVSGTLDQVLTRLAEFAEKEAEVRSRIQAALIYPLFLLGVGVLTIFILLTFVMPRLINLFADLGTELPFLTRVLIKVSHFFQSYWWAIAGTVAALSLWLRSFGLSEGQKKAIDEIVIHLPIFGCLIEKAEVARFLRSLELLYENGIPLFRAVEVATHTVSNRVVRQGLEKVPGRLEAGQTLAKSLEGLAYISNFVTNMVSVGEESGELGAAVRETATFYEQETAQFVKIATSLLEPMMILGVGIVIGLIVVAMLLPVFDIHVLSQ